MNPESAIGWARMVAGRKATDDDVKNIACALMQAERAGYNEALGEAADDLELLTRRVRGWKKETL